MLDEVSSAQLAEWMAFESVDGPLGNRRADYLFAMLGAVMANSMRSKGPAKKIEDFLLWPDKPELSESDLMAKINSVFGAMGG